MMPHDKIEKAKGRLKQAAGALTGNRELERSGRLDEASADAKEKVGKASRAVEKGARKVEEGVRGAIDEAKRSLKDDR